MKNIKVRYYFSLLVKYLNKYSVRKIGESDLEFVYRIINMTPNKENTPKEENILENKPSKIHLFKRTDLQTLPRVKEIIGIVRGLSIETIVDFGSQRGALLFPLLDQFPNINFKGVDIDQDVFEMLSSINSEQFEMIKSDITKRINEIDDKSMDLVIISEVLEHLENPYLALCEASRISKKYLIITVPSKPDDNPEHIQFFKIDDMVNLIKKSGFNSVNVHSNRTYNLYFASF